MNLILSNIHKTYHFIDRFKKISSNKIYIRISGTITFHLDIKSDKEYVIISNNNFYYKIYHIKNVEVGKIIDCDNILKIEIIIEFDKEKTIGNTNLKTLYKIYNRKVSLSNILKDI